MKGGSVTDKICSRSNFVVERQAATTLFDGQTEERRKNAAAHFRGLVAAQVDVPSLEDALGVGGGLGEGEEQGFDAQAEWQEDGDDGDDATAASSAPSPPITFPDLDEMLGFGGD